MDIFLDENNPRKISEKQLTELKQWMAEYGDLGGIVHNETTGKLISGHQRIKTIGIENAQIVLEVEYDAPNEQGTTATGYVLFEGERFNYRRVRWSEDKARKAILIANKAGGEFDWQMLRENYGDIMLETGFTQQELLLSIEQTAKEQTEKPMLEESTAKNVMPIVPKMSEKYDCVVIVVRNAIDWNWLQEKLGLERGQSYKSGELGVMKVIQVEQLIEKWK